MVILREEVQKHPRRGWILFFVIVVAFLVLSASFTFGNNSDWTTEHNVLDDMDALWFGIISLTQGDIVGFFDGLVGGIPVIALFLVLFAITHFLFSTIFKKMLSKNMATVLALCVSLYGFIDHRVYNYILSLNAFAVGFLVFCAILIMLWGFSRKVSKDFKDDWKDSSAARKKMLSKRNESRAIREESKMERKGYQLETLGGKRVWVKYGPNNSVEAKIPAHYV